MVLHKLALFQDTILKLKESTKKLLCVLEEIQSKTHGKNLTPNDTQNLSKLLKPIPHSNEVGDNLLITSLSVKQGHSLHF